MGLAVAEGAVEEEAAAGMAEILVMLVCVGEGGGSVSVTMPVGIVVDSGLELLDGGCAVETVLDTFDELTSGVGSCSSFVLKINVVAFAMGAVMVLCVSGFEPGIPKQTSYTASSVDSCISVQLETTHRMPPSPSVNPERLGLVQRQSRSSWSAQVDGGNDSEINSSKQG
jgi:hypothetical protein